MGPRETVRVVILGDETLLPDSSNGLPYSETLPGLLDAFLKRDSDLRAVTLRDQVTQSYSLSRVLEDWFEQVELKAADVVLVGVGWRSVEPHFFLLARKNGCGFCH